MTKRSPRATTTSTPRSWLTGSRRKGWTRVQHAVLLLFQGATLEQIHQTADLPTARVRRLALKHRLLRRAA